MRWFWFVLLLLISANAFATHVAVLETMADGDAKDSVSLLDRQYLTNVLREQAVKELPAEQNYTIMTRENISAMLPPGKAVEDCEGSCLAETGRNIAADYICQARVGRFGSKLTLSAELYETAGNKLITSFNGRGADVEELLKLIEEKSPAFFRRVKDLNKPQVVPENSVTLNAVEESTIDTSAVNPDASTVNPNASSVILSAAEGTAVGSSSVILSEVEGSQAESSNSRVGESVPSNVKDEPSKSAVHWISLSISVVVAGVGAVLAVYGNSKAKDAAEEGGSTIADLEKNRDDAKFGQTMRGIGIGLAIAGAVGIGLSIAF